MSAMPDLVKVEVDAYCAQKGLLKSVFVLSLFGSYDSKRIIAQWFQAVWDKYLRGVGVRAILDTIQIDRAHYDKVVKIMPSSIKRDAFIHAATNGLKKTVLIESVFGAYDFKKIIDAWFYAVWKRVKNNAMVSKH